MLIKYILFNSGRQVIFKIIEQDERLRRDDFQPELVWFYSSQNNVRICSDGTPFIDHDAIYLRGHDKVHDNDLRVYTHRTKEEAETHVKRVNATFKLWMEYLKEAKEVNNDVQIQPISCG